MLPLFTTGALYDKDQDVGRKLSAAAAAAGIIEEASE